MSYENSCQKLGPEVIFKNLTSCWPPLTFGKIYFYGQNAISYVGQCYHMSLYEKNVSLSFFKENYLFLILIDLEWPLRNAHVKLEWLMYVRDIIWVFIPKIVTYGDLKWLLGSKCYFLCGSGTSYENVCWKFGPWVHFSKLSILTSSDLWGFLG